MNALVSKETETALHRAEASMKRICAAVIAWCRRPALPGDRRGIALIACLFVLFFLASLALSYGFAVRLELNTAQNFCD